MRHRFLDPRHVDDALAQDGFLHEAEFLVRRLARRIGVRRFGQDQPHELRVETVFDGNQRRCDAEQRRVVRRDAALDDRLQRIEFAFDARAQRSQPEHAERVADLAQHLELRLQVIHVRGALADEDVEDILDACQVLADGSGNGAHQSHARCRQRFGCVGRDGIGGGHHVVQTERLAHRGNALAGLRALRDVIQQVIQHLGRRRRGIALLAFLQALQLAVDVTEHALDRHVGLDPAGLQRLEQCTDHPPQLEQRLRRRRPLELHGDFSEMVQVFCSLFATDPAEQCDLEARTQPLGELGHFTVADERGRRLRLFVRTQVEQQQSAFRQQSATADGAQVVQQRQQHEWQVARAGRDAFHVRRQLLHRPHQRVETVRICPALAGMRVDVAGDEFHFLGQQRAAVDLGEAQRTAGQVDVRSEAMQRAPVVGSLGKSLESHARFIELGRDFARDHLQRGVGLVDRGERHRILVHAGQSG